MISPSRNSASASVRSDLRRNHRELNDLLVLASDCLDSATSQQTAHTSLQIVQTFRRLQNRLAMHFTLEEAFGYGEDEFNQAPWLSERAAMLRAEHDVIFARFKAIVRSSERLLEDCEVSLVESISMKFETFLIDLRVHENREADLLLSIFDDDLGVGD